MPRGDRTGPEGRGPRTGRSLGFCSGYDSPGFTRGFPRGGAGFGRRFIGRGYWRDRVPVEPYEEVTSREPNKLTNTNKKEIIKDQIKNIEEELKGLKEDLKKLK